MEAVKQKANRKMREALRSAISNERGVRFVDNDDDDDGQASAEKTEPEETFLISNEPNSEQVTENDKVDGATTSTAVPPSVVE